MTISANLVIKNSTGCTLDNLSAPEPKDGSFDSRPASSISPGSSTTFKVVQNNSVSPGPEGFVTYDMNNGNQVFKLQFNWMYSSGPDHPESYTVSPLADISSTVTITDDKGDNHDVTYEVRYQPQAPLDWDMVWALSVGLMNSQLEILMDRGFIPWTFTQPVSPTAAVGSDDAWPALIVGAMDYPSVVVPDSQTQHLDIHLPMTTATLQYLEGGVRKTLSLSGDTVIVSLDLSQQQVTDAATLSATTEAQQQIQGLQALNYGVYRIFADLRNPALFRALRVVSTEGGGAISLSSAAQSTLETTLAGIGQLDVAYPVQAPPQPSALLVPTRFSASTTQDTSQPLFSSVNLCMMTRARNMPTVDRRFNFTAPIVPTDEAKARMMISQDTFGECYLAPVVLKVISEASGFPGSFQHTSNPLCYQFSSSKDNGDLNGGRGQKVNVNNGFDQYVYATGSATCTTAPDVNEAGHPVVIGLTGSFKFVAEVSQYPLDTIGIGLKDKLGTNTYAQPWTGKITVSAGEKGELLTQIQVSLGKLDSDENSTLDGYISNFFDSLLGWTTTSPAATISKQAQVFVNDLTQAFVDQAQVALSPDDCVVLPTGAAYRYANMVFNGDGAIQIDVSFPG
ncbi:hypothetical protein POL68_29210 [Stigmatella sp. ncwal1]|uniref:Uncharacterized protein n=1 Tax=Stigmatella ashevillensis TaxID=2995309 RepID=A0ABT5DIH7_9BACT|nr:hypothetical protein [Stigmatella ashevillena]MDC0712578.1 hypothetical protein [Stigmatella ashevillena]